MAGKPAPDLEIREWLGRKPPALETPRGSAVLLFFWAHYCEDSRAQGRVLVRIRDSFDRRGLQLIGPTRRYGYLDEYSKRPASSRREVQHIKQTLSEFYSDLSGMFITLSDVNFDVYGVSTAPTLVLIDRGGIVRCYHPGRIPVETSLVGYETCSSHDVTRAHSGGHRWDPRDWPGDHRTPSTPRSTSGCGPPLAEPHVYATTAGFAFPIEFSHRVYVGTPYRRDCRRVSPMERLSVEPKQPESTRRHRLGDRQWPGQQFISGGTRTNGAVL
jgi:hypothetical protein